MPNNINHSLEENQQPEEGTLRIENEALRKGFTIIPNYVLRARNISRDAKLLYGILLSYAWQKGSCFPGYDTLMEDMQCAREALVKYIKELKASELIEVKRRGQGKTSIYTIKDLPSQEEPNFQKFENRTSRSSGMKQQKVRKANSEEDSIEKDSDQEDIDPSNIRNAKSDEFDYVNLNGTTNEASEGARLTHNDEVEHSQYHSSTKNRNVEEAENEKNIRPTATRAAAQLSSTTERNRKGGLAHIGQALQDRLPITPAAPDDAVARDAIERYIRDTAAKLHDEAPLKSSVTRAWNDYKRSGVDLNRFFNELYDAEKEANRRSATIKKLTELGFKNRMAYFFAILEDKLGLREKALPNAPQSP